MQTGFAVEAGIAAGDEQLVVEVKQFVNGRRRRFDQREIGG